MIKLSKHTTIVLGILLLLLLLGYSCSQDVDYSKTRTVSEENNTKIIIQDPKNTNKEIYSEYNHLIEEYKEGLYVNNWTYNATTNNIVFNKKENSEAAIESHNHILGLAFEEHIAKENTKTLKYQAVSPFANMDDVGPYARVLKVNGEVFSGVVVGTHVGSGNRILEIQFYEGIRVGIFNVWTNVNHLHTKSFKEKLHVMDIQSVRKPIIYLYPKQEQDINVQVNFKGTLTHTYPKYPSSTGWDIKAQPDGMLTDNATGKAYSYLFWEGISPFKYSLDEGFVVKGDDIANFLDEKLEVLGLNRREATDFITYWLPELEKNPFNLIHFSTDEYSQNAPLEITPAPETLIRVFMVYKPLEAEINIPTQKLTKATRKGYTVVEWGGKRAKQVVN